MGDMAPKAVEAGYHDEAAPFLTLHQRNGMTRQIERRGEIGTDHLVPLLRRYFQQCAIAPYADIRDQDVEAAESCNRAVNQPLDVIVARDILLDRDRFAASLANAFRNRLDGLDVGMAVDHHLGAERGKTLRDRAADIAARPGHQRDPAVEAKTIRCDHEAYSRFLWLPSGRQHERRSSSNSVDLNRSGAKKRRGPGRLASSCSVGIQAAILSIGENDKPRLSATALL